MPSGGIPCRGQRILESRFPVPWASFGLGAFRSGRWSTPVPGASRIRVWPLSGRVCGCPGRRAIRGFVGVGTCRCRDWGILERLGWYGFANWGLGEIGWGDTVSSAAGSGGYHPACCQSPQFWSGQGLGAFGAGKGRFVPTCRWAGCAGAEGGRWLVVVEGCNFVASCSYRRSRANPRLPWVEHGCGWGPLQGRYFVGGGGHASQGRQDTG